MPENDNEQETESTMPNRSRAEDSSNTFTKDLGKLGIPAGLVVAVVLILQAIGVPYGQDAAKEKTELALTIAEIRTDLRNLKDQAIPGVKSEVQDLRADLISQNQQYVAQSAFRLWIYKMQVENQTTGIRIPNYE